MKDGRSFPGRTPRFQLHAGRHLGAAPLHFSTLIDYIMKTYDINEAADFLKIDRSTALELAHVGTLPGAKVGRAWVFMEDELVAYLRDVTRKQTQARRAQLEVAQVINRAQQEPKPRRRGRSRPLPDLPELGGQVAAA
jgi:excisionase family DNA binding protein